MRILSSLNAAFVLPVLVASFAPVSLRIHLLRGTVAVIFVAIESKELCYAMFHDSDERTTGMA
jgi:hypothetical protein